MKKLLDVPVVAITKDGNSFEKVFFKGLLRPIKKTLFNFFG
jgi:hypothetical protein